MGKTELTQKVLFDRMLRPADDLPTAHQRYLVFSNYGAMVAAALHATFFALFLWANVQTLVWFNLGSVLFYFACIYFNFRGYLLLNLILVTLEVVAHAILSTIYLGWSSGFHFYILAMSMVIFFTPWEATYTKVTTTIALFASYMGLKQISLTIPPKVEMPGWVLTTFDTSNVLGFVFLLASFAFYYNKAASDAEKALNEEHKVSATLLANILPAPIINKLKCNQGAVAERFTEATTLFSDIVGFTQMSAQVSPEELVNRLNEIFISFDHLAEKHNLEKIKTIGDAYMVAGGVPLPDANHAIAVTQMGLDMVEAIESINRRTGSSLQIRVGINTGPVIAGVIGRRKFAYDMWGDSVNTASRMESHGQPGRVHISESTYNIIKDHFECEERGEIEVKGKGRMKTWLVLRKSSEPLATREPNDPESHVIRVEKQTESKEFS